MACAALVKRVVALAMSVVVIVGSLMVSRAEAGLITTEQLQSAQGVAAERSRIHEVMMRADVRQQMIVLGVDPAEAEARLASLSDEEVRDIAGRLDQLPAGQGVFETAIIAGLFAFVILLVTDIMGYTDVFPFVTKTVEQP